MRRLISLIIASAAFIHLSAAAQSAAVSQQQPPGVNPRGIVESSTISGIDEDELSADVRDAVRKLQGKPFDQSAADEVVVRIQAERPAFTASVRLAEGSGSDSVKVIFVVEQRSAPPAVEANVNSRYTVERVDIEGEGQSKLSPMIRDEMQKLVGAKLDSDKANQILQEINRQLRPVYSAVRKVMKGSDPLHVVVVYEIHKARVIPFLEIPAQRIVYHSKQNFSADVDIPIDLGRNNRLLVGASDDQDALIERFAGFNFGFESTSVGTDRLGLALRYARYHERWQPATVLAARDSIYRERNTFDPSVTIGFDPRLRLTAGLSLSELQIQYPATRRANSNASAVGLVFQNTWSGAGERRHAVEAEYDVSAGNNALDSDFIFTRHFLQAQYVYGRGREALALSFRAGRISGNAPLFERFSLGDSATLRGWNKFDIAPAGGNRMIYASIQYGFGTRVGDFDLDIGKRKAIGQIPLGFHVFYDVGAVGDEGAPLSAKHSAGFGFGGSSFFIELGFPIRSSRVEPVFSTGFRF